MALAAACAGSTPVPTATTVSQAPTATTASPAPTATVVPQVSTPILLPIQEWYLQGIAVEGDTVTVSLFLYVWISVGVTVGGTSPSRVDTSIPILEFVFENVAAGEHPVVIKDVVGYIERTSVKVQAPDSDDETLPDWLAEWVADLEAGKVEFPPQSITRYRYRSAAVYYVLPQCCDQFTDLLDADGNLIGHPDGGIAGRGDGITQFSPSDLEGEEIWPGR